MKKKKVVKAWALITPRGALQTWWNGDYAILNNKAEAIEALDDQKDGFGKVVPIEIRIVK